MPFEYDHEPAAPNPTRAAVAERQGVNSWIPGVLVALVAVIAWGLFQIGNLRNDLHEIARQNTNQLAIARDQLMRDVSAQISNQVAAEFKQPGIRATIEQMASEKANDVITNAVWTSLTTFRDTLNQAHAQLVKATNDLAVLSNDVKVAQEKMTQIASVASDEPALLRLVDQTVTRNGSNYVLTLFFKATNNKTVGQVDIVAGTYRQTAKIIGYTVRNVESSEPIVLNDTEDAARLKFRVARVDAPVILNLELSAATIVKLVGDALEEELTQPVAIDKMQVPVTSR